MRYNVGEPMNLKLIFGIILIGLLLITGCTSQESNVKDNADEDIQTDTECSELDCSACDLQCPTCPKCTYNEQTCSAFATETIITQYVCSDGETIVENITDCPVEEEQKSDYECQDIGTTITKNSISYANVGPAKVTLVKVCKKIMGDKMRLRFYWKVENQGTNSFDVHPHQSTLIILNQKQYDSDLFNRETETDDFSVGSSSGGELKTGTIAEGGVSIDNLPIYSGNIKVYLEIGWFDDFEFNVNVE